MLSIQFDYFKIDLNIHSSCIEEPKKSMKFDNLCSLIAPYTNMHLKRKHVTIDMIVSY